MHLATDGDQCSEHGNTYTVYISEQSVNNLSVSQPTEYTWQQMVTSAVNVATHTLSSVVNSTPLSTPDNGSLLGIFMNETMSSDNS